MLIRLLTRLASAPVRNLLLAVALAGMLPAAAWSQAPVVPTGDGLTTDTAYQISELGHLVWMHDQAQADATSGRYYMLTDDIDATATAGWNDASTEGSVLEGFNPIGNDTHPFQGIVLGQGHRILGLTILRLSDTRYLGLFGYLGSSVRIERLTLEGGSVMGGNGLTGSLAGYSEDAVILDCHTSIVCSNTMSHLGGLIGWSVGGQIENCSATGDVSSLGTGFVGGLIGWAMYSELSNVHATGNVSGDGCVGGLVGESYGNYVVRAYATGSVAGSEQGTAGLIGQLYFGMVEQAYATGSVTGNVALNPDLPLGGLIGLNWGVVTNVYAQGNSSGRPNQIVGGLIGVHTGTLTNAYALGSVVGPPAAVGGLNGVAGTSAATYGAFWNVQTSGLALSAGGTSMTTQQMMDVANYTSGTTSWDFSGVWGLQGTYPYLRNLPTRTLTFRPAAGGRIGDGQTTGSADIVQVANVGATGMPVAAVADVGQRFTQWSDGHLASVRTVGNIQTDATITAQFVASPVRPGAPALSNLDYPGRHLDLALDVNGNLSDVTFAIRATADASTLWVQPDGSLGAVAVYRTAADWGAAVTVGPLADMIPTTFAVIAHDPVNGENSAPSDSSGAVALPVTLSTFSAE